MTITECLLDMQEVTDGDFAAKLLPTVARERVIGVRLPLVRKLAKQMKGTEQAQAFMRALPHYYMEENHLHAYLIGEMRDVDACYAALDAFLPCVDNWSVCDSLRPKCIAADPVRLMQKVEQYLCAEHPYTVRFGIEMLMVYCLDEWFSPAHLARVAAVQGEEYYVKMMIAWYFATALAKQWDATVCYLEDRRLSPWVHAKTIQKAVESFRVSEPHKAYLKGLR